MGVCWVLEKINDGCYQSGKKVREVGRWASGLLWFSVCVHWRTEEKGRLYVEGVVFRGLPLYVLLPPFVDKLEREKKQSLF